MHGSDDQASWSLILAGFLQPVFYQGCVDNAEAFDLPEVRSDRYIKFVVKSFYNIGGGLQYIGFEGRELARKINEKKKIQIVRKEM